MRYEPEILTVDGKYFKFRKPNKKFITLNSVARGLANTCRFGGQCSRFYSVAEHSIYVSILLEMKFLDQPEHYRIKLAREGLFHDAPEAFICDMVKPLKEILPDYQEIESLVEIPVYEQMLGYSELDDEVKWADMVMLATEQGQVMNNYDNWIWTGSIKSSNLEIKFLNPQEAYDAFLERESELRLT